ncbi:hypothetical protein [Psychrobacter sp. 16-MNA-CIBAN-0192]|uniref:hypothetical protein n=1 Tax=Psychrobacter sp. 16-MNA-CIBAN-0192 TaxID=3140448 RepID=UPI003330640D
MFDYNLKFDTEQKANESLNPILEALHPSQYVRYDIGQIKNYEYDANDLEAEPVVTIVDDKWHVNIRLRTENSLLDEHRVYPETPSHEFS